MFRTQQNAFDDAVGRQPLCVHLEEQQVIHSRHSQGNRREPDLGKLGIHSGIGDCYSPYRCPGAKSEQDVCDRVSAEETGYDT